MPPLSSHHQLKYVRNAINELETLLLPNYRAGLAIHEIVCNYNMALEDIEDPATQFSLIQTFAGTLDTVKQNYSPYWSLELEIHLRHAKLNLYAMVFLLPLNSTPQSNAQCSVNRQIVVSLGSETALGLIDCFKNLGQISTEEIHNGIYGLASYPRYIFKGVYYATIFLFRTVISNPAASQTQRESAIQGVTEALRNFRLIPMHGDVTRAAGVVETMLNNAHSMDVSLVPASMTELEVTNRLGASLLWDTLARYEFGGRPNKTLPEAASMSKQVSMDRLPLNSEVMHPQAEDLCFIDNTLGGCDEGVGWSPWDAHMAEFNLSTLDQPGFLLDHEGQG
jgi:hypothetical protein